MLDWQQILREEGPAVWRTAYRILGNPEDAEECFQEAFLAALEVSRREPVQCWRALLLRLASTRAVDQLRRRCRRPRETVIDWDNVHSLAPPPSQAAEDRELAGRLREALGQFPPRQAEVFCLHCLEGWSYQEIAGQLAVSVDAVGVLLHRARQRLRHLLSEAGPPPAPGVGPRSSRKEMP